MFGIGTTEILIILVVALIVIGPKKLPEVAKTLGKALGEFKRMSSDVKRTIDLEAERAEETHKTTQAEKELFAEKKEEPDAQAKTSAVADGTAPLDVKVTPERETAGKKDTTGKEA